MCQHCVVKWKYCYFKCTDFVLFYKWNFSTKSLGRIELNNAHSYGKEIKMYLQEENSY